MLAYMKAPSEGSLSRILFEPLWATFLLCLASQYLGVLCPLQEAEITLGSPNDWIHVYAFKVKAFCSPCFFTPNPCSFKILMWILISHFQILISKIAVCALWSSSWACQGSPVIPSSPASLDPGSHDTNAQCPLESLVKPVLTKCHNSEGVNNRIYFLTGWRLEFQI